jgi:lipopolysaccharide biosynthesis regulator YciM
VTDKKQPPKGQKPFLGDEELSNELDAWDSMFDNLHGGPEAAATAGDEPVMAWPEPAPPSKPNRVPEAALTAPERTDEDLPPELEEQLTLDRAATSEATHIDVAPAAPRASTFTKDTADADPAETDFSDIGAAGRPSALGDFLGATPAKRPTTQTGYDDVPVAIDAIDEEDVYTSASRPRVEAAPDDVDFPIDEPTAPPPRATPPAAPRRTGPAIIRRATPVAVPLANYAPQPAQVQEDSPFAENTRVADVDEMASARAEARSKAPTAPPPFALHETSPQVLIDEDDYADIEIGADANEVDVELTPPPADAAAPRRTAAHVVRRPEKATKQPVAQPKRESDPVIEVADSIPIEPAGEDDFSDVAAAVGAEDDLAIGEMIPRRRPETPPGGTDIVQIRPSAQHVSHLDAALDSIGDSAEDAHETINMSVEDVLSEEDVDEPVAAPTRLDVQRARARTPDPSSDDDLDFGVEVNEPAEPPEPAVEMESHDPTRTLYGLGAVGAAARPTPVPENTGRSGRATRPPALTDVLGGPPAPPPRKSQPQFDQFETYDGVSAPRPGRQHARMQTPLPIADDGSEVEPSIDLEAIQLPEQVQPLPTSQLDEDAARTLEIFERELATVDETATSAALRIEAGRLCERLGETDRARAHYDAALLADPRATAALRGLRRIARASGDLIEATRQLDAELAVAGALERRPLAHYRIDLLLASGEQDLARVAVGEILDSAPSDVRSLLAQLELAFLDGRADEFGRALEQLTQAVSDTELRAAIQSARGVLAAHQNDSAGAATWFASAAESDPASLGARLGAIRQAVGRLDGEAAAVALVDLARQVEATDPTTAAALALRAQHWTASPTAAAAAQLATAAAPHDPLVLRVAAETASAAGDPATAGQAFAAWAAAEAAAPTERSYAAARAAELDPARGAELWRAAITHDPGDDYAAQQLRTAHVAAEATQLSIDVDLEVAADTERERARLRAAFQLIGQSQLDAAIELLQKGHADRPESLALTEALAEALAAAGKWSERAKLLAELAADPGERLDREVAQLRSALAWEEAVGAATAVEPPDTEDLQRTTAAALDAWGHVLDGARGNSPAAHAAALVLAQRLGDRDVINEVIQRAQQAEASPWAAASLGLRRARALLASGPEHADAAEIVLRETSGLDDPRRTAWLVFAAARRNELGDASIALEERATQLGATTEAGALRLRAAQLALDSGDAARATTLLAQAERAFPAVGIISDLLAAARRRSGDRPSVATTRAHTPSGIHAAVGSAAAKDAFARIVRDGDLAASHGDGAGALALYQRALELRPGDPLAALPLVRLANQIREPGPLTALALEQLKTAETAGDNAAKADAYELLAHIDKELRADAGAAQIALESASQADPTRIDLMHRLEREYAVGDQLGDLVRLRRQEIEQLSADTARDRAALIMDTAGLAERDQRPDAELTELYRSALANDPRHRLALLHLESIVRRGGGSADLAALEEQIAAYFDGDPRTQATFFTRAGETLAEIGQIDAAVQKFGKADEVQPGHVPALEGWRNAALKGQLWIDVAQAATRQGTAATESDAKARLHHFAGVVLMDKALEGSAAMAAFRRALDADPSHKDSFLRLRILLEEDANHDELAVVLAKRLDHETDERARVELHRAVAELHRNFLDDRETAKRHYREILASDPNDLRSHAAVADIAWEQGAWQEAADALMSRARLENDPKVLTTLLYRLGLLYADRLNDPNMALRAFQRALSYQPDDENTLVRLADLATQTGEWKLALGACERLVKATEDPEKRAQHLHRVAKIFKLGFGDAKRAERALNLALDGAPTNDEALQKLVEFYREAGDMQSVRVHLNRVAGTMRTRVANDPKDGVAYRVIARAMAARGAAGVDGSIPIARAAAELATLLGAAGEPERVLLAEARRIDLAPLLLPDADEVLFPRTVQPELRTLFTLLGDKLAKHVGIDLRAYGVGRGDRLRAKDSAVAANAQDVATGLGFGEIDVYVSTRQPYAMIAEPTSPVSLVIGAEIAKGDPTRVRFAAGAALKLAQASLAIPARLSESDLGVLVVALLRQFQPDFPQEGLDDAAIATQMQKLRRLIPTGLLNELRPHALAVDAPHFKHEQLARDLRVAGLRAGLVASGSILAGLGILAASADTDVPSFLANPVAQGLITFALGEDHAAVTR